MNNLKKSGSVCRYRCKSCIFNQRFFLIFLVYFIYIYLLSAGILDFSNQAQTGICPWLFPLLVNDWICQIMIAGGFLWIISSLCSQKNKDLFIRVRAGEFSWKCGTCLTILLCSFVFICLLTLSSFLVIFPRIEWSLEWGKILTTLAKTNASSRFNVQLQMDPALIGMYRPLQAFGMSFILEMLCLDWLALLLYCINCRSQSIAGIYVALAFIFLDVMLSNTFRESWFVFSPVTLVQLRMYTAGTLKYHISFQNTFAFYLIGIAVFIIVSLWKGREGDKKFG